MFLHKLCLFTLATLAASTNVGTLDVQIREFEVPTRNRGRMIPRSHQTARFGTPDREQTSSVGLIRRLGNSRSIP